MRRSRVQRGIAWHLLGLLHGMAQCEALKAQQKDS